MEQINSLEEQEERSIPVGSVQLTQSSMILAGHPDVMYQNIFPSEMSILNQDAALRLDPEENWRLLYPFTEPGVRRVEAGTPASMARLAHSDSLVETIQTQIYLEDIPEWGQHDFRRYPARFGDPNYVYQPHSNGTLRDRNEHSQDQEQTGGHDRINRSTNRNRYVTPINNLRSNLYEQSQEIPVDTTRPIESDSQGFGS